MKTVAIIGAGLAGTALAYTLKKRGFSPVIYDAGDTIASGASGNDIGLYNPRFTAEKSPEGLFYSEAFFLALDIFKTLKNIDWNPCGALHLITNDKKAVRFPKTIKNWDWDENDMRIVDAKTASDIADISLSHDALYLPRSGYVSPQKLCHAYAQGVEVKLNTPIESLDDLDEEIIIIASGAAANIYPQTSYLPLRSVRGQITQTSTTTVLSPLKTTLCYSGYCTPVINGRHTIGSTFQRWLDHTNIIPQDDIDNIEKLNIALSKAQDVRVTNQRAALRCTSPDHFPIIGQINARTYISTAHGSHGILSSLMGANIITDAIADASTRLPVNTIDKLSPARFFPVI